MKKTTAFFIAIFFIVAGAYAQKIKLVSGDLSFLKEEKVVSIEYDYSQMGVGKFKTEQEYLDKKSEEYNKKESGRGDEWVKSWKNDRATRYQPKFEELLNKYSDKLGVEFKGGASKSKVVMIVKTTFTEPGYNIYVSRRPALINLEVIFKKEGVEVANITLKGAPGSVYGGYDFDTGVRITEAYAKAGKELSKFFLKKAR
jgi:hypothetical protein